MHGRGAGFRSCFAVLGRWHDRHVPFRFERRAHDRAEKRWHGADLDTDHRLALPGLAGFDRSEARAGPAARTMDRMPQRTAHAGAVEPATYAGGREVGHKRSGSWV